MLGLVSLVLNRPLNSSSCSLSKLPVLLADIKLKDYCLFTLQMTREHPMYCILSKTMLDLTFVLYWKVGLSVKGVYSPVAARP